MSALMNKLFPLKGEAASVSTSPRNPINGDTSCGSFAEPVVMRMSFEVYTGKGENVVQEGEADCGASGNVVIRLARSIQTGINHKLFFDNYFTSPELQIYLAKQGKGGGALCAGNAVALLVFGPVMP